MKDLKDAATGLGEERKQPRRNGSRVASKIIIKRCNAANLVSPACILPMIQDLLETRFFLPKNLF